MFYIKLTYELRISMDMIVEIQDENSLT